MCCIPNSFSELNFKFYLFREHTYIKIKQDNELYKFVLSVIKPNKFILDCAIFVWNLMLIFLIKILIFLTELRTL